MGDFTFGFDPVLIYSSDTEHDVTNLTISPRSGAQIKNWVETICTYK